MVSVVAAGVALAGAASTQALDPVVISPNLYTVRLENAYVRVLEYRSHPGDKDPLHSHRPGVVFYLSDFETRVTDVNGQASNQSRKAGEVIWRGATTHAAENIGKTDGHYLWVELKVPLNAQ